jgi:hypothetical protein
MFAEFIGNFGQADEGTLDAMMGQVVGEIEEPTRIREERIVRTLG